MFALLFATNIMGQKLLSCADDTTFVREYVDGEEWNILTLGHFIVGISNSVNNDKYGKFYQMKLSISNVSDKPYTFDPADITTYVIDEEDQCKKVVAYTSKKMQNKIAKNQAWTTFFNCLSATVESFTAGNNVTHGDFLQRQVCAQYLDNQMAEDRKVRDVGYLKKNTIHANETIVGHMNIKFSRGELMNIIIPLGDKQYVFVWDVTKKSLNSL